MREPKLKSAFRLLKEDIKKSRYAVLMIAAYLLLKSFVLHNACPFAAFTGFPCPGCGLTRAGIAMLKGEFALAWELHPFIYIFTGWVFLFIIWRYFVQGKLRSLKKYAVMTLVFLFFYYLYRIMCLFGVM